MGGGAPGPPRFTDEARTPSRVTAPPPVPGSEPRRSPERSRRFLLSSSLLWERPGEAGVPALPPASRAGEVRPAGWGPGPVSGTLPEPLAWPGWPGSTGLHLPRGEAVSPVPCPRCPSAPTGRCPAHRPGVPSRCSRWTGLVPERVSDADLALPRAGAAPRPGAPRRVREAPSCRDRPHRHCPPRSMSQSPPGQRRADVRTDLWQPCNGGARPPRAPRAGAPRPWAAGSAE